MPAAIVTVRRGRGRERERNIYIYIYILTQITLSLGRSVLSGRCLRCTYCCMGVHSRDQYTCLVILTLLTGLDLHQTMKVAKQSLLQQTCTVNPGHAEA